MIVYEWSFHIEGKLRKKQKTKQKQQQTFREQEHQDYNAFLTLDIERILIMQSFRIIR